MMKRRTKGILATSLDRQAGFTLIELLVSLMILALILSFIPGTLRIGRRVWETEETFEQHAALSSFRRYVEQRLAEAMPIYLRDPVEGVVIEFSGQPNRVSFVAPAAAGPAGGGVYRFELRRDNGSAPLQRLILSQSLYRITGLTGANAEDGAQSQSMRIDHGSQIRVANLSFRYFGAPDPQAQPQWQAQWPLRNRLPDLVEISLVADAAGTRVQRSVVKLQLQTQ